MNIVILSGSPRRGGNSDLMCDAFARGAQANGHTVNKLHIAEMNIAGCKGCFYCRSHNETCVQQDDMHLVDQAMLAADMVVFASPIYSFTVSGQLKCVMDRMFAHNKDTWPIRQAAILLAYGDDEEDVADGALFSLKRFIDYYGWKLHEPVLARAVIGRGEVKTKTDALERAEALGRSL